MVFGRSLSTTDSSCWIKACHKDLPKWLRPRRCSLRSPWSWAAKVQPGLTRSTPWVGGGHFFTNRHGLSALSLETWPSLRISCILYNYIYIYYVYIYNMYNIYIIYILLLCIHICTTFLDTPKFLAEMDFARISHGFGISLATRVTQQHGHDMVHRGATPFTSVTQMREATWEWDQGIPRTPLKPIWVF